MTRPTTEPIHTAEVNNVPLGFYPSPLEGWDLPWFAFNDLPRVTAMSPRRRGMTDRNRELWLEGCARDQAGRSADAR